jgi:hypothetical protein
MPVGMSISVGYLSFLIICATIPREAQQQQAQLAAVQAEAPLPSRGVYRHSLTVNFGACG